MAVQDAAAKKGVEKVVTEGLKLIADGIVKGGGKLLSWATVVPAIVDEHRKQQLAEVQDLEACPHIALTGSMDQSGNQALAIAGRGTCAWKATNGVWVYHPQRDYGPLHAIQVYRWDTLTSPYFNVRKPGTYPLVPCRRCVAARQQRG